MGWFDCIWGSGDVRKFRERVESLLVVMNEDKACVKRFAKDFDANARSLREEARVCLSQFDEVGARTAVRDALNKKHLREKALSRYNWLTDKETQMYGMYMSRAHLENDKYYVSGMHKLAKNEDPDKLARDVDDVEAGMEDFDILATEIQQVIDQPLDTRAFAVVQEEEVEDAMDEWFGPRQPEVAPAAVVAQPAAPVYAAPAYSYNPQPHVPVAPHQRAETDANDEDEDSPDEGPVAERVAGFQMLDLLPGPPSAVSQGYAEQDGSDEEEEEEEEDDQELLQAALEG